MNKKIRGELLGVGALVLGLFVGLTLLPGHLTGGVGDRLGAVIRQGLGLGAVLIPILGIGWALAAFGWLGGLSTGRTAAFMTGLIFLVPYVVGVAGRVNLMFPPDYKNWSVSQQLVGMLPGWVAGFAVRTVGTAGGILIGVFVLTALSVFTIGWHPLAILRAGTGERSVEAPAKARGKGAKPAEPFEEDGVPASRPPVSVIVPEREPRSAAKAALERPKKPKPPPPPPRPAPRLPEGALIPPPELLTAPTTEDLDPGTEEIEAMGQRLVQTLETFRVGGTIADRTVGPVVTRYELEPGPGVKVGRIAGLADDLALAMKARSLRIVAPIPGKARVGIEVPNPRARMVTIRELVDNARFHTQNRILPVVLGRDLEGQEVYDDLAKMPHLLIAGATGSGKSVCINAIITSLIYSHPPDRLQMLMVDPKMVELSMYGDLPHLRLPVVTSHHKAATVLKWAQAEMERRYKLLHANGARNMADFNRKVETGRPLRGPRETLATQAGVQKELPFEDGAYKDGILPYIVLVVDELADLMLTVQGEIETPLASLAQKARAIGIHLILATQRPSVNVITGLIKANFPCRIAFRVSAKVDSRTILDQNGAETLLGNGDMLFLPPGKSEPVRVQGAYIATEETERIMEWYRARKAAEGTAQVRAVMEQQIAAIEAAEAAERGGGDGGEDSGERDTLFRQAAEVCIQNQLGSTSLLQRRMSIGYGRAARIIDQLEMAGILGPANGSKPRDVLVGLEELDEICGT
ncbi:MAG TPA: DNA translocase FtsK [Gemmatimonadales bacterium]|nr:DNA translocase FtsK [Gemmatimonadales bacterium]